jgi:hypothetical protein
MFPSADLIEVGNTQKVIESVKSCLYFTSEWN